MRREIVDWITIPVRGGSIRFALTKKAADMWFQVGDRRVPSPIVLELREPDAPALDMTIEVLNNVPRIVDLRFWRHGEGREVRKKDLGVDIESLIEQAVALASARVGPDGVSRLPGALQPDARELEIKRGIRTVQNARTRSQRPMTPERLRRIAEVYQTQETGGIEAVAEVYNVHRATAARWIAKAREGGYLPPRADKDARD